MKKELNQFLPFFKLAHFNPNANDNYGYQLIEYLVLDALTTYGPLIEVKTFDIKDYIKKRYLVDFDEYEIENAGERLLTKKRFNIELSLKKREEMSKNHGLL